jgi:hypothetical protein
MKPAELYILNQPEPYRSILLLVQAVIEHTIPEIKLQFKYKIPFYYYHGKPFVYLNATHKRGYVDVAFMKGYQLKLHQDCLDGESRTLVKSLHYSSLETIDNDILIDLMHEQEALY